MANDVEITQVEKIDQLKEQGRAYLRSNQADMAIRVFAKVWNSTLMTWIHYWFWRFIFIDWRQNTSLTFYLQAWRLAPDRRDVQRRLTWRSAVMPKKIRRRLKYCQLNRTPGAPV
jgi:hypothetical protein